MRTQEEIEKHVIILYATLEAYHDSCIVSVKDIEFNRAGIASLIWVLDVPANGPEGSILEILKNKYFNLYENTYRDTMEEISINKMK